MKREIKFRAWNGKEMSAPFTLFDVSDDLGRTYIAGFGRIYDEDTIMQYTGLRDRNRVEIYEGDMVKIEENTASIFGIVDTVGKVMYFRGMYVVANKDNVWNRMSTMNAITDMHGDTFRGEVIGNIYENPELLTNKD